MTQTTSRNVVDLDAARTHHQIACQRRTRAALWATTSDIPVLIAEITRLRSLLALSCASYANLLASARATLAGDRDGELEPLLYLRHELDSHGQLPPHDMHPSELLALTTGLRESLR